jgi:hypothetical protein
MRVMVIAIAVVVISIPSRGLAQGTPAPINLPAVAPGDGSPLPSGKEISRPLTPVEIVPDIPAAAEQPEPPKPNPVQRVEDVQDQQYVRRGPLGPGWDDFEYLLWWPKSQPLPPLVTGTRSGVPPILGRSSTSLLLGGHMLENQDISGGRFTIGASINSEETVGVEAIYFFLGSRTLSDAFRSQGNPAADSLGLPFMNSATGQRDAFLIAAPGISSGSVYVSSTTRVQGAEGNFVANLYDGQSVKLNGIMGYRYLQVNEGIAIEDTRTQIGGTSAYGPIYDGFDGHNQFNGGQLGLHADITHGMVFCELTGKVAIGMTSEVVKIDGATAINTPGLGGVTSQTLPGGVYALPSNIGRYSRGEFAVVPEGIFKVGLKMGDVSRFFVGYNFLYLSDLARPGDQIDRTLNSAQIPSLNSGGAFTGADRPRVPFIRSDFWTQGLIIGLETRY